MITVAGDSAGTFETADTVRAGAYVLASLRTGRTGTSRVYSALSLYLILRIPR